MRKPHREGNKVNYNELTQTALSQTWAADLKAKIDLENKAILADRQKYLDSRQGIGVGDFVFCGEKSLRVAHDWGDCVQLTDGIYGASFYLGNGCLSYSGGLNPGIDKDKFKPTNEFRIGPVWFFSQNFAMAHNGYHTNATFRVWILNEVSE
jgi:hypothetical protein